MQEMEKMTIISSLRITMKYWWVIRYICWTAPSNLWSVYCRLILETTVTTLWSFKRPSLARGLFAWSDFHAQPDLRKRLMFSCCRCGKLGTVYDADAYYVRCKSSCCSGPGTTCVGRKANGFEQWKTIVRLLRRAMSPILGGGNGQNGLGCSGDVPSTLLFPTKAWTDWTTR